MISELFFYVIHLKVGRYFARNPLTHTVTHITKVFYGQSITNQHLLAPRLEKTEKLFETCLQNILFQICAEAITSPLGVSRDNPKGFLC